MAKRRDPRLMIDPKVRRQRYRDRMKPILPAEREKPLKIQGWTASDLDELADCLRDAVLRGQSDIVSNLSDIAAQLIDSTKKAVAACPAGR